MSSIFSSNTGIFPPTEILSFNPMIFNSFMSIIGSLFRPGIKIPFYGSTFEVFSSWQRYRAFINESLPSEMIEAGSAYDYYRGASINVDWKLNIIKPRLDGGINPSNGLKLS